MVCLIQTLTTKVASLTYKFYNGIQKNTTCWKLNVCWTAISQIEDWKKLCFVFGEGEKSQLREIL